MLRNPKSLYVPPEYSTDGITWHKSFVAATETVDLLSWDVATIMSTLFYGFPLGDRTIFTNVTRRPWLAALDRNGKINNLEIPEHDYIWVSPKKAAQTLFNLLHRELADAVCGFDHIFVPLSGGLDSRIVAGVLKHLKATGHIEQPITCMTWGLEDSRDVQYARLTAETLKLEWRHAELTESDLERNIVRMAYALGAANSPIHLHRMDWVFDNAPQNSIVIAGSYGDSVGRAEFSRRTVLELLPIRPINWLNLLTGSAASKAKIDLQHEIKKLHHRSGLASPYYVKREHEQQAHYMRNLIANSMSIIDQSDNCNLYQAFTSPDVYSYMWTLHPAIRNDRIYANLLELIDPTVARLPWARSNRPLRGDRTLSSTHLVEQYHRYDEWVRNILVKQIENEGEEQFLSAYESIGCFNIDQVRWLFSAYIEQHVSLTSHGNRAYSSIAWMLSLKNLYHLFSERTKPLHDGGSASRQYRVTTDSRTALRRNLSNIPWLRNAARKIVRHALRVISIFRYPPKFK